MKKRIWKLHFFPVICSWHQKNKTRILQFTNLKCCKMPFKAFTTKKQGLKCFFKVCNKEKIKKGVLNTVCMQHFKLVNSWFRFLMSRTGYWFITSSIRFIPRVSISAFWPEPVEIFLKLLTWILNADMAFFVLMFLIFCTTYLFIM